MKPDKPVAQKKPEAAKAPVPSAVLKKEEIPILKVKKKPRKKLKRLVVKIIVFNVVNAVLVVLIVVLIGEISGKAVEVRDLRNEMVLSQKIDDAAVLEADVEGKAKEIEKVKSVFVNEDSFLKFLDEKDRLQATGVVTNFSVSDKVVKDGGGNKGYALLIEFKGGLNEVKQALEALERLPFLMRTASLDVSVLRDENLVKAKYVGFLYVNE